MLTTGSCKGSSDCCGSIKDRETGQVFRCPTCPALDLYGALRGLHHVVVFNPATGGLDRAPTALVARASSSSTGLGGEHFSARPEGNKNRILFPSPFRDARISGILFPTVNRKS